MRWIVFLYLMIGIVLLVVGFFATSDCPNKNARIENDIVFILTWPVSYYGYVIAGEKGPMTTTKWLHVQACEGGLDTYKPTSAQ
jgi:hypothetical protein